MGIRSTFAATMLAVAIAAATPAQVAAQWRQPDGILNPRPTSGASALHSCVARKVPIVLVMTAAGYLLPIMVFAAVWPILRGDEPPSATSVHSVRALAKTGAAIGFGAGVIMALSHPCHRQVKTP